MDKVPHKVIEQFQRIGHHFQMSAKDLCRSFNRLHIYARLSLRVIVPSRPITFPKELREKETYIKSKHYAVTRIWRYDDDLF